MFIQPADQMITIARLWIAFRMLNIGRGEVDKSGISIDSELTSELLFSICLELRKNNRFAKDDIFEKLVINYTLLKASSTAANSGANSLQCPHQGA